jgi:hypothetical protein
MGQVLANEPNYTTYSGSQPANVRHTFKRPYDSTSATRKYRSLAKAVAES